MGYLARLSAATISGIEFHLRRYRLRWYAGVALVVAVGILYGLLIAAPVGFEKGSIAIVAPGSSARAIGLELAGDGLIKQPLMLRVALHILGPALAGEYRFTTRANVFTVAARLSRGDFGIAPVRLTFIEGATVGAMGKEIAAALPSITAASFAALAAPLQGYLFPDTYLVGPDATAASLVHEMRTTFDTKTASLAGAIAASGHTEADVITMASILQAEAKTTTDQRIIAGILWKRLSIGMALQVDAAPLTYKTTGLPATPIDNPGLEAIQAALTPTKTNYLYYISDPSGQMHYAATLEGQVANEKKYLK